MLTDFIFCITFAFLNRARGSQLFGLIGSTTVGRLVSMLGMALLTGMAAFNGDWAYFDIVTLWTFATLLLWCVWAWDCYWGMAIGTATAPRAAFAPVDWIMSKLYAFPPMSGLQQRLWGLIAMTLRMTLIAPCLIGLAFISGHPAHAVYACGFLALGLPYFISGYLTPGAPVIRNAELGAGALIGALILLTIGG